MERRASQDVERQVRQLLKGWASAVAESDAERVVAYYKPGSAVIAGALEPQILRGRDAIKDYFSRLFSKAEVEVHFADLTIREFKDLALCHGRYTIRLKNETPKIIRVRFLFAIEHDEPMGWHIIEHHASIIPDSTA